MDDMTAAVERAQEVKQKYEEDLMGKANVVGVGVGFRQRGGQRSDEVALVVMVERKVAASALDEEDVLPKELDGVPVDVQAVGQIRAGG